MTDTNAATQAQEATVGAVNKLSMEISKTIPGENGKPATREKVGDVSFYAPALSDFGLADQPTGKNEDGSLIYTEIKAAWLYKAVVAQVKAQVRNMLKPSTVELKPGAVLPTNLIELVTPSESTNTTLADRRALLAAFNEWLANSELMKGRPDALKVLLKTFMEKPDTLIVQPYEKRVKIGQFFQRFGEDSDGKMNEYQENYVVEVIKKCQAEEVDLDFSIED